MSENIQNETAYTDSVIPAYEPKMIPIDIMMISGDNETPPADRMTYAQIAWVTSEQLHGRIKMRLDDLQAEINKCVEENNGK